MSFQWTPPPDRYDWRRYLVLRVAGSTPTTDPEDAGATEITVTDGSTRTTNTCSDSPGHGTWSYSVFCVYDEYASSTDERYSLAKTYTTMAVGDHTPTPTATATATPTPTVTPTPTATPLPAGTVKLTWTAVPDRYDWRRYLCLRIAGATEVTGPTDAAGTAVTITNGSIYTTEQLTDEPGDGTWTYSVFAVYDEYASGTDERYSEIKSVTVVVTDAPTPTATPTATATPTSTPTPTPTPT